MKARYFWPVLAAGLFVFMLVNRAAQQTINIGTSANDNTGDTLRTAFQKVNSNFTELYQNGNGSTNIIILYSNLQVNGSTELDHATVTNAFRTPFYDFTGASTIDASRSSFQGATLSTNSSFNLVNTENGTRLLLRFLQNSNGGWTPIIGNLTWLYSPTNWNTNADGISFVIINNPGTGPEGMLLGTNTASTGGSSGGIGLTDFDPNQFRTNGGTVSIKDGVLATNLNVVDGTLWVQSPAEFRVTAGGTEGEGRFLVSDLNGVMGFRTQWRLSDLTNGILAGDLLLNGGTNRLSIRGNQLYLDGVQVTGGSESTPVNNFYSTNNFFVSGKGNTLVVTQALTLQYLKTNLLSTDANGLVTTTKFGSGLTWDPATQTLTSTGSGGTVTSVGLTLPAEFSVSGSPVTGSGTLAGSWANVASNRFLAGPINNGAAAAPTFRVLGVSDFNSGSSASSSTFWRGDGTWAMPSTMTNLTAGFGDGSISLPTIYFSSNPGGQDNRDTGFYRPGADQIGITINGTSRWIFGDGSGNGTLQAPQDNTTDIGESGARRPRNLYLGSTITAPSGIYASSLTLGGNTVLTTSSGLASSWSAGTIVGNGASGAANWILLTNAYQTAKSATPHGSALSSNNRYTIYLLDGVYDAGSQTLVMDTQFIDIVGLSPFTGDVVATTAITSYGDTILTSSTKPININNATSHNMALVNLCLKTTTSSTDSCIETTQSAFGADLRVKNVLLAYAGSGNRITPWDKGFGGYWEDVRAMNASGSTGARAFGASVSGSVTINGTFIRVIAPGTSSWGGENNNGVTLSGYWRDCEGGSQSWAGSANGGTLSGTFINNRVSSVNAGAIMGATTGTMSGYFQGNRGDPSFNNFGGGTMSGVMVGNSGTAAISWSAVSGTAAGNDFPATSSTAQSIRGNVTFPADNTHDIGATAATRPRSLYLATSEFIQRDAIGSTVTDILTLTNSTAAATNAQQYSGALKFSGKGFSTSTAGSSNVDWRIYLQPVQGSTPTANLLFDYSINGGAFTTQYTFGQSGAAIFAGALSASQVSINSGNKYLWSSRSVMQSPSDGVIELSNNAVTDFGRLQLGGTSSSFPAIKRSGTTAAIRLADDTADAPLTASTVTASSGFSSTATDSAVAIAATGWTNTFGKLAVVNFDGTAMTFTKFNNAGTAIYTNAVAHTGAIEVILQTSGAVTITGTSVTGRAAPL